MSSFLELKAREASEMLRGRLISNSKIYVFIALAAVMASLAGYWNSSGADVRADEHSAQVLHYLGGTPGAAECDWHLQSWLA